MATATERSARGVRPLERDDLPRVAALYEAVMRPDQAMRRPHLVQEFERLVLDQPWADPEVPSLVLAEGRRIRGFIASHVRRAHFDGEPLRLAYGGQFVTDEETSRKGLGALLLRRFMGGPQDLTLTDGATPVVQAMWERLGGDTVQLRSISWTRLLRPAGAVGGWALRRRGLFRTARAAAPALAVTDAALRPLMRPRAAGSLRETELEPATVVEALAPLVEWARLVPDYDEPFLRWLFSEMAGVTERGTLVRRALHREDELAGWYVAYLNPGGIGQVLQVAAARQYAGAVLDRLIEHAWSNGTAALQGRLEPLLFEPTAARRAVLRFSERVLVHSRDPEITRAVHAGEAYLTRMDGEWWVGTHLKPETPGASTP